ncbi:MAG: signal recognition particle-docking protein FtsY [Cyanobacteria bacterium J003]|uniref:signal recognition particle-docking protein FtsY n=1 Tax=Thermosynechococcus sp. M3746_W2019_013 TaxID=2747806 RepID=UPI000F218514|nr:signal recognition particle-docking protein FtsY [Thermosynechococcus sp. M3746_W2019_013]RMH66459.1 MAG: signal recognition particle-docking protein FtsY [Cyanobacteria bacterium J003]HIK22423.1 signal recognition particle-docking protein FtsY [Thermosynechococcus sp. M3746_W2019_013]
MVFNWFRRKFGGSGEEPSPAAESPTEAPPAESTESTASPSILNWAKTALQSIQARQASQRPTTVETTEETQETPTAEAVAADAPLPVSGESAQTAVADEPAAVQPVVEAEPGEPDPSPVLDEGFLWSAAVLAAQGRRPEEVDIEEITWLQRLRQGLGKTRRGLVHQLRAIVGQGPLSRDAVEAIEMLLLQADVGVKATDQIIAALQTKIRQETLPADQAIAYLKEILRDILDRPFQQGYRRNFAPKKGTLNIWLIAGVNGVGKTTTIGKLAHIASQSGYRCLIAAADTFRAAATEQVKIWGQRSNVEVIANPGKNTDPAAVVFDAIGAAQARGTELLLVDTAGRLQNKANLMEELKKIRRIIDKKAGDAQIESLLVLDATLGQNGLRQAQIFAEAAQLTGVILTKLDGTAKGGVALAVVQELGLPIRFIGAGEGIKDLRPFSSFEFVEALLSSDVEVAA